MDKYLLSALVGALAPLLLCAQAISQHLPDVDSAEVYRRGEFVEAIGQGPRSEIEEDYLAAMAPPADDSHKWFITVISQPRCPPCEKLKSDLNTRPELQAFVNVTSPKQSWAHFNSYSSDDKTQIWRFANIKIAGYPTILVQPPMNKRYGDPATVVMQKTGYADSTKLAEQITASIKVYVAKRQLQPRANGYAAPDYPRFVPTPSKGGFEQVRPWERDPPFKPAPKTPPPPTVDPAPVFPDLDLPSIPSVINPDAVPAPGPTLVPPEPVKPAPTTDAGPVATVIIDGNVAVEAFADPRFGRVLSALKARMTNLTVKIRDFAEIKKEFPHLNKHDLPAILVTQDGAVKEAMTSLLLPLLNDPQSQSLMLTALQSFLATGAIPWVALAAIGGFAAIRFIRARRQAQGLAPLLGPGGAALLQQLLESEQVKNWLERLLKPKPIEPAKT